MHAETLIWHDTDKKGRPRQRDCSPSLISLRPSSGPGRALPRLRLKAEVDPMGRSLRPMQIQHWLSDRDRRFSAALGCAARSCDWAVLRSITDFRKEVAVVPETPIRSANNGTRDKTVRLTDLSRAPEIRGVFTPHLSGL